VIPESCSQLDSTSMLMLQLACILNMVSVWKRGHVRVFLCTDNLDASENERRKARLDELLNQLRISAYTVIVPFIEVKNMLNRPIISEADLPHYQQQFSNADVMNTSDLYLRAANQLIRQYSDEASLCFLYMPPPLPLKRKPQINNNSTFNISMVANDTGMSANSSLLHEHAESTSAQTTAFIAAAGQDANEDNKRYMRMLDLLSDSLPPTIYVNGVSCVTSTRL
jgi:hypothetical protein